jgi:hypothetical protein
MKMLAKIFGWPMVYVDGFRWRMHGRFLLWALIVIPKDTKEASMLKMYLESYFEKLDEHYAEKSNE